jgi:bacterial leucyl aminopeptidase
MSTQSLDIIFFDIGGTLGQPVFSDQPPHRIIGLDVFEGVLGILAALKARPFRLGVISNIGEVTDRNVSDVKEALAAGGILPLLDPDLLIFGRKDSPAIFEKAAARAGRADRLERCLFVGDDAGELSFASAAGFLVSDSPSHVEDILGGSDGR